MSEVTQHPPRVVIPRPDRVRRIGRSGFGWIDARLRSHGWLELLSPEAFAVYAFLCLVADRDGVSWYRRDRICHELGLAAADLQAALGRLRKLDLAAYRPFGRHASDGFHQVLGLPADRAPAVEEVFFGPGEE